MRYLPTGGQFVTLRLVDLLRRPRRGPAVLRGRAAEAALALLLEDVRRPTGDARGGEHRREQIGRPVRVVEDHRRPDLDVGGQDAVGTASLELGKRGLLERLSHLESRR